MLFDSMGIHLLKKKKTKWKEERDIDIEREREWEERHTLGSAAAAAKWGAQYGQKEEN